MYLLLFLSKGSFLIARQLYSVACVLLEFYTSGFLLGSAITPSKHLLALWFLCWRIVSSSRTCSSHHEWDGFSKCGITANFCLDVCSMFVLIFLQQIHKHKADFREKERKTKYERRFSLQWDWTSSWSETKLSKLTLNIVKHKQVFEKRQSTFVKLQAPSTVS